MKIKMTIEVEVEDTFNFTDEEEKMWFENEVLIGDGTLMLHSNEIGDTVGIVKKSFKCAVCFLALPITTVYPLL